MPRLLIANCSSGSEPSSLVNPFMKLKHANAPRRAVGNAFFFFLEDASNLYGGLSLICQEEPKEGYEGEPCRGAGGYATDLPIKLKAQKASPMRGENFFRGKSG